jgi:hypothetical protein
MTIIAEFIDYPEMLDVLRARLESLGLPHSHFDAVVGVATGYTNMTLGGLRKKPLGAFTMLAMFKAAGMRLAAIDAPELARETHTILKRPGLAFTPHQARKSAIGLGRQGGFASAAMLTAEQRSEKARYAALCRYYGGKRKGQSRAKLRLRAKLAEVARL